MSGLKKRATPDRSKIDLDDAKQVKYWTKALDVSQADLIDAIGKVGNAAAAVRKELQANGRTKAAAEKPLKPEDFPVTVEGRQIKTQDGTPIAKTPDPAVAEDIAERLNEDDARREEDKWSA